MNLTVPILDVGLGFAAITPPLAGARIDETTSGPGDIIFNPMVGWAFGVTGYQYEQIRDNSGSEADRSRNAFGVDSLRAKVNGAGPIITYSGRSLLGGQAGFKLKYTSEFNAKNRSKAI